MVIIGIDPHKGSHTAVAIDEAEAQLAEVQVRADRRQLERLLKWVVEFPERYWAIESAEGLGGLLSQQLLEAGEEVFDVPPTLSARVRVLATNRSQKNDPNDAYSVAVAVTGPPDKGPPAVGVQPQRWEDDHSEAATPHTRAGGAKAA